MTFDLHLTCVQISSSGFIVLSFTDLRILMTNLVYSNSSHEIFAKKKRLWDDHNFTAVFYVYWKIKYPASMSFTMTKKPEHIKYSAKRRISGITVTRYAHNQKIGKPNNLQVNATRYGKKMELAKFVKNIIVSEILRKRDIRI